MQMDDDAKVRATRKVLRQVQTHMLQTHRNLGAQVEEAGLVDVLYHPTSTLPHLNYVSPRQNTAWIPGPAIETGLQRLRAHERKPRVCLVEGLFPPLFAKSLRDRGLTVEREIALMTFNKETAPVPSARNGITPQGTQARLVDDQEGMAQWWYVWRNARYDVVTNGADPVYVGKDMREIALGNQADIILYRHSFPVGVARLTYTEESAHITAVAVMKEVRTPENVRLIYQKALQTALEHGSSMVFTSGEAEADQRICRQIGFVDAGSIVCYAESSDNMHETHDGDNLEQPAFIL